MTEDVFAGLGSNTGERENNLRDAISLLSGRVGEILSISNIYETAPWGFLSDDKFLNMVVRIKTGSSPVKLLRELLKVEKSLGRTRSGKRYESRTIDIDILLYGNRIISKPGLTIPHPLIQERKFVLVPLCDLYPEGIHPVLKKSFSTLLSECTDDSDVTLYKEM